MAGKSPELKLLEAMKVCPICLTPYDKTYEEHTGLQKHKNAVYKRTHGKYQIND